MPELADESRAVDWEQEWQAQLLKAAMQRVKRRVKEEQYQLFDLYVVKQWPVPRIAQTLGVSAARVYLAKHRISRLLRKEVAGWRRSGTQARARSRTPAPTLMTELLDSAPGAGAGQPRRPPPPIPEHQLLRLIGEGSSGQVWLARNALGTYRAVKIVQRQAFQPERPFTREFNGMLQFEPVSRLHDGLVDILQVGGTEAAGYFYCVMELADDVSSGQIDCAGALRAPHPGL